MTPNHLTVAYALCGLWITLQATGWGNSFVGATLEFLSAFSLGAILQPSLVSAYTRVRVRYWLWRQRSCQREERSCRGEERGCRGGDQATPQADSGRRTRPTLAPPP